MPQEARRISVLIVDDIAETRTTLTKLLSFEPDMEVVGAVGSGKEGIARARELRPNVVLMDLNLPDVDGISATQVITRELPGTGVIILSIQGDTDYLRRAMEAGARQFLVKPFSADALAAAIRKVDEISLPSRIGQSTLAPVDLPIPSRPGLGRVMAVFSPKGGVGCSTLAVNLAVLLRQVTGKRVALVDGSLRFGDIALMLNLHDTKTAADLAPLMEQLDEDLLLGMLTTHGTGVSVLPAPPRPETAELVTPEAMRRILATIKSSFDYIVVDTWSSLDDTVLAILDTADQILLTITLEMPCIKDARLFLELTEALKYPKDKVVLVVNRFDSKQSISIADVERSVRCKVAWRVNSGGHLVAQSVNQGVPIAVSNRESPVAQSLRAMAVGLTGSDSPAAEPDDAPAARPQPAPLRRLAFLGKRG